MTSNPWAWALFFVVDCFALYAGAGVLGWAVFGRSSFSVFASETRDMVLLLSIAGLGAQAVATCYLLSVNGWL